MGGGGGADADHWAGQAGGPQGLGGGHGGRAFLLGECRQGVVAQGAVALAGMGHDPAQGRPTVHQEASDADQGRIVGPKAGAMAVAVNLQQHGDRVARRGGDHRLGLGHRVEDHRQVTAGGVQRSDAVEPLGRDPDGVEDVAHPGREKFLGLLQGRDRRRTMAVRELAPRHLHRLGGLHVRSQHHIEWREPVAEPGDVAQHTGLVQHQAGGLRP